MWNNVVIEKTQKHQKERKKHNGAKRAQSLLYGNRKFAFLFIVTTFPPIVLFLISFVGLYIVLYTIKQKLYNAILGLFTCISIYKVVEIT